LRTVLIVEDSVSMRQTVALTLRQGGYEVTAVLSKHIHIQPGDKVDSRHSQFVQALVVSKEQVHTCR
jgi:CheY-like chemotaxis protein